MKKTFPFFVIIYFLLSLNLFSSQLPSFFSYLEPFPGANLVNKETCIIIRTSLPEVKSCLISNKSINVRGSLSGIHYGEIITSDDNSSVIFKPYNEFQPGEIVSVHLNNLSTMSGKKIEYYQYSFTIKSFEIKPNPILNFYSEFENNPARIYSENTKENLTDFPQITINTSNSPSPGNIFMSNIVFNSNIPNSPFLIVLDNQAQTVFSRRERRNSFDFKAQPNGNYTYYDGYSAKFFELDPNYNVIDSFYCRNGYSTDLHELRLLPNGHAIVVSYDPQIVNMFQYLGGGGEKIGIDTLIGDTAAIVTGLIIQEIDNNKNVIFQWRSWDHFRITDATHENLYAHTIDYVHGNAVEIDNDNNLLLSCRHMDEITKIDRNTGGIIWRLGGKNNEFTFTNDQTGFSHQHAIRRIANGNITLFDNGNYHTPNFSRACEYKLDEQNKIATLVWQYRNSPDIYGSAMGYVQRLRNGNTLIGWGAANPSVTEVTSNGTKVFELTLPQAVFSYRAFRDEPPPAMVPVKFSLSQNFPNPFNPVTSINFAIPKSSFVKLTVYDILGRQVSVLENQQMGAGSYEAQWDGTNFSSGIYFYKLVTDGLVESKKMILVK